MAEKRGRGPDCVLGYMEEREVKLESAMVGDMMLLMTMIGNGGCGGVRNGVTLYAFKSFLGRFLLDREAFRPCSLQAESRLRRP
ncbi:hypothetical protein E2C01_013876 [Portunus trituberculatus]|uniref:Uncharacterized protein n=1 Tax=Portunus trituberculatus TaxID=210409 RepID=A0A5B7DHD4_PORTR|nr:hypothetical protein [Portunus trituberculatus]